MNAPALFRLRRRVLWGECDPAGVVYTPRFGDYTVEALLAFLAHILGGPLQQRLAELDLGTPAKSLHCVFHSSLRPDQEFDIDVQVEAIRTRSFDIGCIARNLDGGPVFDARVGVVCVHANQRVAREIPGELRALLEACRAPPARALFA